MSAPVASAIFAATLRDSGFANGVGDNVSAVWHMREFGDVYPHEAVCSKACRLLGEECTCTRLREIASPFRVRLPKAGGSRKLAIVRRAG